jgi:hypothetical protein
MVKRQKQLHLKTVTWSIDSRDWLGSSGKTVIKHVERRLTRGQLFSFTMAVDRDTPK